MSITNGTRLPVTTPMPWRGDELQLTPHYWLYELSSFEISDIRYAASATLARLGGKTDGAALKTLTRQDLTSPNLTLALANWRKRLQDGHGIVLVRGLPVRDMSKEEAAIAFWLLGLHLGDPVSQNTAGETLVDVRDTGSSATDHDTRLYTTHSDLTFHTDGADIIGLLCLRTAKSGGVSRICSSVFVYNEILRQRPDLAPLMELVYQHHAHGQFGPDGPKTFPYPIVTRTSETFRLFLLLWYIRNAATDFPEIASLSPQQIELLNMLEAIPLQDGVALDMNFKEGDMQFLKNAIILHARTEYLDWDEPDEKRHLLRLWLSARDFSDGDDVLRDGVKAQRSE